MPLKTKLKTKAKQKSTANIKPKTKAKRKSTVNVNWAEKLGITAPGTGLGKDLGPLISRNLQPVFQVPAPQDRRAVFTPLNKSWETAVKKGFRLVKQTNKWVEVRIPTEMRALIPDIPSRLRAELLFDPDLVVVEPGYVRKKKMFLSTYSGVEQNKMTNLQTFRQLTRSSRITDSGNRTVNRAHRGDFVFRNLTPMQFDYFDGTQSGFLVEVKNESIVVKNRYFENGRGIQIELFFQKGWLRLGVITISRKQILPQPRPPSTRPKKRAREV